MSEERDNYDLQFLITSGPESPEKAVLGLAAALSALHSGLSAKVVFAMRGAIWCATSEGNSQLVAGYPPIGELIGMLLEEGARVCGCSSCVDQYCPAPRNEKGEKQLRAGIERVGLSVVVLHMTDTTTVTF